MASETLDPIDWSYHPPSRAVPPDRLVQSIKWCSHSLIGNRSCNFSVWDSHLAYAATQCIPITSEGGLASLLFPVMCGGIFSILSYPRSNAWGRFGMVSISISTEVSITFPVTRERGFQWIKNCDFSHGCKNTLMYIRMFWNKMLYFSQPLKIWSFIVRVKLSCELKLTDFKV